MQLKGYQWRKDRKLIGQAFRKRQYFEDVLNRSNQEANRLLSEMGTAIRSLSKGQYIDHHEIFEPTAMKVALGKRLKYVSSFS
jgi:cytochrome P450